MLVVAAEVLLVVALVALNLYLWIRPGRDDGAGSGATNTGAATSEATAVTSPAASDPSAATSSTTAGAHSTSPAAAGPAPSPATTPTPSPSAVPTAPPSSAGSPANALKSAGRLVAVVDLSPAMAGQLDAVKAGLAELARQAPDGVALGLVTYGGTGVQAVVSPAPLDATRRTGFVTAVNALTTTASPERPLFDGLVLAYQYALAGPPGTDPAPMLMAITNGGRTTGADLQTFAVFAKAESAKRARSVTPRFIGITPGADVPLLTQSAAAVGGGQVVAVTGPDRLRNAILDLPAPRSAPSTAGSPS